MAPGTSVSSTIPRLEVLGELAPPPSPRNHFQPANRRHLRLKLMVKRRHKPISDSEIGTIADHRLKKGGFKTALTLELNAALEVGQQHGDFWRLDHSHGWIPPPAAIQHASSRTAVPTTSYSACGNVITSAAASRNLRFIRY